MRIVITLLFAMALITSAIGQQVGINKETPEHTLDVRATSNDAPAGLNVSNLDKSRYIRLFSGSNMFPDPSITMAPGRSLLFASFDDNSLAFNEYMRISSIGDVGIGVVDPQAKLDIKGGDWNLDAGNPGDFRIGNETYNFRIGVATGGGGAGTTRMYTNSNALILGTNNTAALTLDQDGNIGVGTTSPTQKLEISGKIKIGDESTISTAGTLRYNSSENRFEGYTNAGWIRLGQKKKKIVVGASAFTARHSSNYINNGTRAFYTSGNGTSHIIYAPVIVPTGSRITSINYLYYDNDPANDLLLNLYKSCGNSIGSTLLDTHLVSSTAGDIVRNYSNYVDEVVGDDCQYYVTARAFTSGTNGVWTSNLYFVKLYVNYEEL
jgi:hypothetical protein